MARNLNLGGEKEESIWLALLLRLTAAGAHDSWVVCEHCGREFIPVQNETLIDKFLAYYRQDLDWGELCRCQDCGGLAYEKIEGV